MNCKMIINVGLVVGIMAILMPAFTQTCLAQSNANISGIQRGNQTTTSSSAVPTSTKPIMLQGTSTNDKFKVEVNWMPNDISKENTFDIKFLDSKSGREIKGVTYDIVLLTGDQQHLTDTYRSAQTATQQKYNFTDQGSYILNINKINNSPAESVNIPIQVTPEFPVNMLALTAIIAALLGSTIISARWIRITGQI